MATKVTVKTGQTLAQVAKANNTTVKAILADPANKTIAARVAAGTTPVFGNSKVTIPTAPTTPKPDTTAGDASREALRVLTSGGTLTDEQRAILGMAREAGGSGATGSGIVGGEFFGGAGGSGAVGGTPDIKPEVVIPADAPKAPGSAWVWNGTAWAKPAAPQDGKSYTWNDNTGWTAQALNTSEQTAKQVDSIAAITALLASYGIGDLAGPITNAVTKGYSTDTIELIMQDPNSTDPLAVAFQKRFPANKLRSAAGKSVLSAADYLRAERSYTEVLRSYGVANIATPEKLSQFISNDISATEVADRVGLAVKRVQNADPDTKKALAEYYPMLNQSDIIGAVLEPGEGLPALQRKIQIAEIGGAALAQGIKTQQGKTDIKMGAAALADLGVTKEQARQGFQTVAEIAPRGEFLSQISTGEDYTQLQAEQETFQGLASAKRAREQLSATEVARFRGSAGRLSPKDRAQGLI